MDPVNVVMSFNNQSNRLEFTSPEKKIDIACRIINQNSGCLEKFQFWILKTFTRSWIVVKDADNADRQIININSIVRHAGLTSKIIKKENKTCNLLNAIAEQIKPIISVESEEDADLAYETESEVETQEESVESEVEIQESTKEEEEVLVSKGSEVEIQEEKTVDEVGTEPLIQVESEVEAQSKSDLEEVEDELLQQDDSKIEELTIESEDPLKMEEIAKDDLDKFIEKVSETEFVKDIRNWFGI